MIKGGSELKCNLAARLISRFGSISGWRCDGLNKTFYAIVVFLMSSLASANQLSFSINPPIDAYDCFSNHVTFYGGYVQVDKDGVFIPTQWQGYDVSGAIVSDGYLGRWDAVAIIYCNGLPWLSVGGSYNRSTHRFEDDENNPTIIGVLSGPRELTFPVGALSLPNQRAPWTGPGRMEPSALAREKYHAPFLVTSEVTDWVDIQIYEYNQPNLIEPVSCHVAISSFDSYVGYGLSAGHLSSMHKGPRPHSWLYLDSENPPNELQRERHQHEIGGSMDSSGVDVVVGADGGPHFWITSSEVAGFDLITVTCTSDPITPSSFSETLEVVVENLQLFGDDVVTPARWDRVGVAQVHRWNDRYYGSTELNAALVAAAVRYRDLRNQDAILRDRISRIKASMYQYEDNILHVNDISLPLGGLFDADVEGKLLGDYAAPHGGHRYGRSADIRTINLVENPSDDGTARVSAVPYQWVSTGKPPLPPVPVQLLYREAHFEEYKLLKRALLDAGLQILREQTHFHVWVGAGS